MRILSAASEEAKTVGHDDLWATIPLHRVAQELKRSLAVSAFRGKDFDDLALMINRVPKVMLDTINAHEDFVNINMPEPKRM